MKDAVGMIIVTFALLGFVIIIIFGIIENIDRSKDINVVEVHEQQASIEYCDRHNICEFALVDRFELVYKQFFNNFTYYIRFEVDGELKLHPVDRTRVTKLGG